ncbi:DUF2345 domain-containing protein [Paraburkholderia sp. EG287B]|uniref:DUF2345 domain-containing protein n=1 Tax=Paraburkholderia sp. EG287B TaxID=3237010 RepID=UPI0034D33DFF
MQIRSTNGRVTIEAKEELLLKCGGSCVQISSTGIEDGTKGNQTTKSTAFSRQGHSSLAETGEACAFRRRVHLEVALQR